MLVAREANRCCGRCISYREVAFLVPEKTESWLSVNGHRVVHFCRYSTIDAVGEQLVSVFGIHHVEVINDSAETASVRYPDTRSGPQPPIKVSGVADTGFRNLVRVRKQPFAYNCLKCILARVIPQNCDGVAVRESVISQQKEPLIDVITIRRDNASV